MNKRTAYHVRLRPIWCCCLLLLLRGTAVFVPNPADASEPSYCTVYNHLVKNGGTSIKEQLVWRSRMEHSRPPGLCTSDGSTSVESCYNALRNSSVIMGYGELLRNSLHDEGRDCQWFMMMRHPISQLVSAFYYCPKHDVQRRPPELCGNRNVSNLSLEQRLTRFAERHWTNMTYRQMLHSIFCQPWFELCSPERARYRDERPFNLNTEEGRETVTKILAIMQTYAAIGIVEEWELSMSLFDAVVVSPVRHWDRNVRFNRGEESTRRTQLLHWAYLDPTIHTIVAADLLLYSYGVAMFKHQTSTVLGADWSGGAGGSLSRHLLSDDAFAALM